MQEFRVAGQHGPRNHDYHQERYQNHRQGQPQYRKPTQFTKMEFPKYVGDDILTWLLKCERFFELDDTPEESKVKMASLHLDDKTFQWHRALERRLRNRLPSWDEYAVLFQDNFGPAFENPMSDLTHLRQIGSLIDYNAEFDFIAAKLDIAEYYLVGAYVSALKPELAGLVQMFNPKTLTEARQLARMQELIVDNLNPRGTAETLPPSTVYRSAVLTSKSPQADNSIGNTSKTLSLMPKNPNRIFKPLTPEEELEHRTKNLCFYCHAPFEHKCPQRQKFQLHYISSGLIEDASHNAMAEPEPK
ncbi:hypothetical protein QN277_010462 [Acacia crassicarpa]|uniref:Retrotransposon gag domain-containing protein n=1 Tax=Acacia crassicarpa TaxID=499986 RepID=A0AAE1M6P6_9FABA|nr:hypothetical protein QN277_010462 [Acacia crassicarpa]